MCVCVCATLIPQMAPDFCLQFPNLICIIAVNFKGKDQDHPKNMFTYGQYSEKNAFALNFQPYPV